MLWKSEVLWDCCSFILLHLLGCKKCEDASPLFRVSDMSWCTFLFLCHFSQHFSCARIVSTNSVLPGKSRLFPLHLYRVIKPLFLVCISVHFALFSSCVYRVKKLFFCSNFPEFSSCALSCYKTLFLCALLRILCISPLPPFVWKVRKNCCHALI